LPPPAASLPAKERRPRSARSPHDGGFSRQASCARSARRNGRLNRPSALSFLLAGSSLPALSQTGRDCLAAQNVCSKPLQTSVRAFARNTARAPARILLRPLSPTTAFHSQ